MKPTTRQIETFFNNSVIRICDDLKKRVDKFYKEYKNPYGGKGWFLDITYRNVLLDMIYYRDSFKTAVNLCKSNGLKDDSFAIEHSEYYIKRLKDIELKSFISILKIKEPWIILNQKTKDKYNEELCKISKEVMDEILEEEKIQTKTK